MAERPKFPNGGNTHHTGFDKTLGFINERLSGFVSTLKAYLCPMSYYLSAILICSACILTACTQGKKMTTEEMRRQAILFAWNEDTVLSYQFLLLRDNRFAYTIIKKDSGHEEKQSYFGKTIIVGDTVFLQYADNNSPAGAAKYLIKEGSGNYLIQYFTGEQKRLFMRIRGTSGGHGSIFGL